MESISDSHVARGASIDGAASFEMEPPQRAAPRHRLQREGSRILLSVDMEKSERDLTELDPDRAPWLTAILAAYSKQKQTIEVCSLASSPTAHPTSPPHLPNAYTDAALLCCCVGSRCGHTALLVRVQQYDESLSAVEATVTALEGSHHAKLKRRETSRLLGRNSGLAHTGIVDDGGKMLARHEDGLLVVSAADMSVSTKTTLGFSEDASGSSMKQ